MSGEITGRPWPQAASYEIMVCDDPNCGPHILALDGADEVICEVVIMRENIPSFCKALQDIAYKKSVERDD